MASFNESKSLPCWRCGLLAALLIGLTFVGCKRPEGAVDANAILKLPKSQPAPDYAKDRVPKLTVDGKDVAIEAGGDRDFGVRVEEGKTVAIVYSFWPKSYSNTIRTKKVKVEPGQKITVNFHEPDPNLPDDIRPIYYPTPAAVGDEMCKMAKVGKDDIVYDIGCGDGRLVIGAVKRFNARKGVGVDIDAELIKRCKANAAKEGVSERVEFRNEDALKLKNLSEATVVLLYVGEDFGKELAPVLKGTLKPGARVVSHRFPLGDWRPDDEKTIQAENEDTHKQEDYVLKLWKIKGEK